MWIYEYSWAMGMGRWDEAAGMGQWAWVSGHWEMGMDNMYRVSMFLYIYVYIQAYTDHIWMRMLMYIDYVGI